MKQSESNGPNLNLTANANAILYARVSTEDQADKYSISSQLREMRSHAGKLGYKVVGELVDDGYTGSDMDRPALTKLRESTKDGAVQAVIVYEPDRLSRKLSHLLILTDEFERRGVKTEFVTTPNTDTVEGKLMLSVKGVIAEYEKEKIRERTIRGRTEKARQGYIVGGKHAYGYRIVNRQYSPEPVEADVIRDIFRWVAEEGMSIRGVVARLNREGIKPHTSHRWRSSSVHRILSNEIYVGRAYYNRRERQDGSGADIDRRQKKTRMKWKLESAWISIPIPAIVDDEIFAAVQQKLTSNIERKSGRPSDRQYLLRGLLKCGMCGRRYTGNAPYYRCAGKDSSEEVLCKSKVVQVVRMDAAVWGAIARLLSDPELLESKLMECAGDNHDFQRDIDAVDRQIADIRAKESRLLEALLEDIPLPGIKAKAKELSDRRIALEHSRTRLHESLAASQSRDHVRARVLEYCQLLSGSLEDLDFTARQQLLNAMIDEVVINGSEVTIRGIVPFDRTVHIDTSMGTVLQGIPFKLSNTLIPHPPMTALKAPSASGTLTQVWGASVLSK